MHPFTGLALLLPAVLLAWRIDSPSGMLAMLALPLAVLSFRPQGRQRLRQWFGVLMPLALGLLLVHGRWLDSWPDGAAGDRGAALLLAARLWLRVAFVLACALLWLSSTPPERLVRALLASRLPPGAAYLLASPLLLAEQLKARLAAIAQAQAARGVDVGAPWFRRWRSLLALAMPLLVWTLSDVGERAAALDARAFRSRTRRTTLDAPRISLRDRSLMLLALTGAAVIAASFAWH
jgi:energy-coupling factor transport system permease protein